MSTDSENKEIFISCSSTDIDLARYVKSRLISKNLNCFLYEEDIVGGENHEDIVPNAIRACKIVLLIESPASLESKFVNHELTLATNYNKAVIELQIDPCDDDQLNNLIYKIGNTQRVIAHDNSIDNVFGYLVRVIEGKLQKIRESEKNKEREKKKEDHDSIEEDQVIFDYDSELGIMYNPKDGMRNVSFRQDTFLTMMRTIYQEIGPEKGSEVFFKCGYDCGRNFGMLLNNQWKKERIQLHDKITRWCEFDSQVGWGKFISNIDLDEDNGTLSGNLCIRDCFFVDIDGHNEVCAYIKGYCTGVMNKLLSNDIQLTCTRENCPMKNTFKSECTFKVAFKGEE